MAEGSKILKYGCFGCLGLFVVLVVIAGSLVGVASMQAKGDELADKSLERALPEPDPQVELSSMDVEQLRQRAGKVHLDLSGGEFRVSPGEPGEPIRVKARYSEGRGELTEKFVEATADEGWRYDLTFRNNASGLLDGLRMMFGGIQAEVEIFLPPDIPFALDLHVEQGGANMDLGTLWITEGDFDFSKGGVNLDFDAPLKQPMTRLRVDGSMGGFNLSHIGNASPKHLIFNGSMGGMNIDLRGEWRNDSIIEIDVSMGGGSVSLPRGVRIEGLDDKAFRVEDPREEIPVPVLRFERATGELQYNY